MVADDLVNAKSIKTEGLMKGIWERTNSEKNSKLVFKSESDDSFSLIFERAYSVAVEIADEGVKSYHYFWDPVTNYLTQKPLVKEDNTLTVNILSKDAGIYQGMMSVKIEELTNKLHLKQLQLQSREDELQLKQYEVDDLKSQLKSVEYICQNQETYLIDLEKQKKIEANKDEAMQQSQINIKSDEKPLPKAEEAQPPPRYSNGTHYRSSAGHPDNPPYYPTARPGLPPRDMYGQLPQGAPTYAPHRGYEAYGHDLQRTPYQPQYEPVPYLSSPYFYGDNLRAGENFTGYSGGGRYCHGPPNPGPRPPPYDTPVHSNPKPSDQYPGHPNINQPWPKRDYAAGEPAPHERRGEPTQVCSNYNATGSPRQLNASTMEVSNAHEIMGIAKSSKDKMNMIDQRPKSSVPSRNPYLNVKAPIANNGARNWENRERKNLNWPAGQGGDSHLRNPYESISENPYKDVVSARAEAVEGSVVR